MSRQHCVYILSSKRNGALYVGVTCDLIDCVLDHKFSLVPGITNQYAINRLVYFEWHRDLLSAEAREQAIRQMHRIWKLELIEQKNPCWRDLYNDISAENYPSGAEPRDASLEV